MNKILVSLLLCTIGLVAGELGDENHHHSTWGIIGSQDKLLRRDVLIDDPSVFGKAKATYAFPSSEHSPLAPYSVITAVKAIDHYTDGNGGEVKLLAGGPQSIDVSLRVKSQVFRGYHFTVEIWGH